MVVSMSETTFLLELKIGSPCIMGGVMFPAPETVFACSLAKECVAVSIGLYRNNGAVSWGRIHFPFIWIWIQDKEWIWIWIRGARICTSLIETATHSFNCFLHSFFLWQALYRQCSWEYGMLLRNIYHNHMVWVAHSTRIFFEYHPERTGTHNSLFCS